MIAKLVNLLDDFPGPANQTRCFTHILNLVVKSVIRQFDLPKSKGDRILDDAAKELLSLAGNIEFEEDKLARRDGKEGDDEDNDNVEGWIDKRCQHEINFHLGFTGLVQLRDRLFQLF